MLLCVLFFIRPKHTKKNFSVEVRGKISYLSKSEKLQILSEKFRKIEILKIFRHKLNAFEWILSVSKKEIFFILFS